MEDMTRKDFERNFHLLQERMKNDKLLFNANCKRTTESISKVRKLPNGRVDFLTVDEGARCLVNTMMHFDTEEFKKM